MANNYLIISVVARSVDCEFYPKTIKLVFVASLLKACSIKKKEERLFGSESG